MRIYYGPDTDLSILHILSLILQIILQGRYLLLFSFHELVKWDKKMLKWLLKVQMASKSREMCLTPKLMPYYYETLLSWVMSEKFSSKNVSVQSPRNVNTCQCLTLLKIKDSTTPTQIFYTSPGIPVLLSVSLPNSTPSLSPPQTQANTSVT